MNTRLWGKLTRQNKHGTLTRTRHTTDKSSWRLWAVRLSGCFYSFCFLCWLPNRRDELVQLVWELRARLGTYTVTDLGWRSRAGSPPSSTSTPGTPPTCSAWTARPASGTQSSVSTLQAPLLSEHIWVEVTRSGRRQFTSSGAHPRPPQAV